VVPVGLVPLKTSARVEPVVEDVRERDERPVRLVRLLARDVVLALVTQDFGALLASYLRKAEEAFVAGDAG